MMMRYSGLVLLMTALAGCSDAASSAAPHGPPGGIVDVDTGSIPLGEGGSGGTSGSHSGGSGSSVGGSAGTSNGGAGTSGKLPPARGVSTPCELDGDCMAPLSCHYDSTDYIGHKQCTESCSTDEQCSTALGKDSFCIGAHICVHACTSDADCAAKTHCNDAGWCERGGPGSGVPYCAGIPTPCEVLSDTTCISSSGCQSNAQCSGIAESCYGQFDSFTCSSQQGCYWSSLSKSCSGSAESCSTQPGMFSCGDQQGCYWTGGCIGVPDACEKQFVSLCTNQPGCELRTD